jgi:hypothetical protein
MKVAISEFKAKCLGILEQLRKTPHTRAGDSFWRAGRRGGATVSQKASRKLAGVHGRNDPHCGGHRRSNWQ